MREANEAYRVVSEANKIIIFLLIKAQMQTQLYIKKSLEVLGFNH